MNPVICYLCGQGIIAAQNKTGSIIHLDAKTTYQGNVVLSFSSCGRNIYAETYSATKHSQEMPLYRVHACSGAARRGRR